MNLKKIKKNYRFLIGSDEFDIKNGDSFNRIKKGLLFRFKMVDQSSIDLIIKKGLN